MLAGRRPKRYAVPKKITAELSGRLVGRSSALGECMRTLALTMGRRSRSRNFSNTQARTGHNPPDCNGLFTGPRSLLFTPYMQSRAESGRALPAFCTNKRVENGRRPVGFSDRPISGQDGQGDLQGRARHGILSPSLRPMHLRNASTHIAPCLCGRFTRTSLFDTLVFRARSEMRSGDPRAQRCSTTARRANRSIPLGCRPKGTSPQGFSCH